MEGTEARGACSLAVAASADGNDERPSETEQMRCPAASSDSNVSNLSSSSTSSSYHSSPGYLKGLQAALKRQRPLGAMASSGLRARRVPISQQQQQQQHSQGDGSAVSRPNLSRFSSRVSGPADVAATRKREPFSKEPQVPLTLPDDTSLTPPSITGTLTTTLLPRPKANGGSVVPDTEFASSAHVPACLASGASSFGRLEEIPSSFVGSASTCQDICSDKIIKGPRMVGMSELEVQAGASLAINQDVLPGSGNSVISDAPVANVFKANPVQKINEQRYDLQHVDPMTQCSTMGSSCVTTMSMYSGPTLQNSHAASSMQTEVRTQMSSIGLENPGKAQDCAIPQGNNNAPKKTGQPPVHSKTSCCGEKDVVTGSAAAKISSQPCAHPNFSTSNKEVNASQPSKDDKASRKKKHDPDLFFKVNGKYYQRLAKIGSGGSSEVYRVICSDCTIYALKRIKLKGRDYPTAYGFCQEILYLNKLKGKSNIIELVDYEVTDKTLLEDVSSGREMNKDGKIKDDGYIYMVLEYGEIDLAHMLSQKWKEAENSDWKINENWLRFYWQQMLEAVNTIHEERIVHSDLKPANFLLVKGSLKLIDFGIAKAIMSDTTNIQRDAQVGTLNYMSPEAFMWNEHDQNGNTIKCGRPSDIWSLGCILYQMVYGKTPFADYKTFWAKFKVITDRDHKITYDPVSNPWLVDLMKKCLAWDRDQRWRIPQLLQHPFLNPPMPPLPSDS